MCRWGARLGWNASGVITNERVGQQALERGIQDQTQERLVSGGCLPEVGISQFTGENGVGISELADGRPYVWIS